MHDPHFEAFTTVSCWDGRNWVVDGEEIYENNKRMSFLQFKALPRMTPQMLELALFLRTAGDAEDRRLMESHGWRIRPNGEGMFRFSTLKEAAEALATINADYERHC